MGRYHGLSIDTREDVGRHSRSTTGRSGYWSALARQEYSSGGRVDVGEQMARIAQMLGARGSSRTRKCAGSRSGLQRSGSIDARRTTTRLEAV